MKTAIAILSLVMFSSCGVRAKPGPIEVDVPQSR